MVLGCQDDDELSGRVIALRSPLLIVLSKSIFVLSKSVLFVVKSQLHFFAPLVESSLFKKAPHI